MDKFFGMISAWDKRINCLTVTEWKAFEQTLRSLPFALGLVHPKHKQNFYDRLSVFELSSPPPTLGDILKVQGLDAFKRIWPVDD